MCISAKKSVLLSHFYGTHQNVKNPSKSNSYPVTVEYKLLSTPCISKTQPEFC